MALVPDDLGPDHLAFLADRHLATLTTVRPDGTPHVAPVGFGYDPVAGLVRIITFEGSRKVRNLDAATAAADGGRAVVCQVDGARWLALEGPAEVTRDPERVAAAVGAYAARYRQPGEREDRVAIEIRVDRILGRA
ncbi:MAG: TIGR03618 family F420-dependent PPOX class oxidoreductase [Actinobacteria bacterium]|nr:TIGR03618 family F420-dependent PPOX class oxidoreductase [Actinomycetota bacterium]